MLTIGISTSVERFGLVIGENKKVVFNSEQLGLVEKRDIDLSMEDGLKQLNATVKDVKMIMVDHGPGGTSSVRTGVAFGNSLAFSIGVPICPVSSLEIAGIDSWETHQIPVLSSIKHIKGNAFMSLCTNGNNHKKEYGRMDEILPVFLNDIEEFAVVGHHRDFIKEFFPNKKILDTELKCGNPEILITHQEEFLQRSKEFPKIVYPLTEKNFNLY